MKIKSAKKSKDISEMLLYLLGIFSTMQILTIFNITLFNVVLVITFLFLLFNSRIYFRKDESHIFAMALSALLSLFSATIGNFLTKDFVNKAVSSGLVTLLIIGVAYFVSIRKNTKLVKAFIDGVYVSCIIQIAWCVAQYLFYNLADIDLNKVIFNDFLHVATDTSTYRNGKLVCTGLCWHAANLVPVLLFAYLKTKNLILKVLYLVIAFESKSATASIAILLCVFIDGCLIINNLIHRKYRKEDLITFIIVLVFIAFLFLFAKNKIFDALESLLKRIQDINSKENDNSSAVHFSYYTQLPKIIVALPILINLFGLGLNCSGFVFSKFFGQYEGLVWVVESDYVNIYLNQGLFGFCVIYGFLIYAMRSSWRVSKKNIIFISVMLVCGITYNLQFGWVLLLELITFRAVQSSEDVFGQLNKAQCDLNTSSQQKERIYNNV